MGEYLYDVINAKLQIAYPTLQARDGWTQFWKDNGGYPGRSMYEKLGVLGGVGSTVQERLDDYFRNKFGGAGPIFKAAGTPAFTNASTSLTMPLPAGWAPNDFALMAMHSNNGRTLPSPAGWVLANAVAAANGRLYVWTRRLQAGDTDPTVNPTGGVSGDLYHGSVTSWSNVNATGAEAANTYSQTSGDPINAQPGPADVLTANATVVSFGAFQFYTPITLTIGATQSFTVDQTINATGIGALLTCHKSAPSPGTLAVPSYTGPNLSGLSFAHVSVTLKP